METRSTYYRAALAAIGDEQQARWIACHLIEGAIDLLQIEHGINVAAMPEDAVFAAAKLAAQYIDEAWIYEKTKIPLEERRQMVADHLLSNLPKLSSFRTTVRPARVASHQPSL